MMPHSAIKTFNAYSYNQLNYAIICSRHRLHDKHVENKKYRHTNKAEQLLAQT
jgi:hypothetical protein